MERIMYLDKIQKRIEELGRGSVFIISDFLDIASIQTAKKALSRLTENGMIRRISRGIYDYPEFSPFLSELVAVSPDKVAHALARNYGWKIAPSGNTALNMLGLSTQVPATWSYVSDGAYRKYDFDSFTIEFKRMTNRDISGVSPQTALVIQALKAIGRDNIDDNMILKLSKSLGGKEKSQMVVEAQYATSWIFEIIKKIYAKCEVDNEKNRNTTQQRQRSTFPERFSENQTE